MIRKHLLWATTVLVVVTTVAVLISDLYLRSDPETYKQALAAGVRPRAYDIVGTGMLLIWIIVAFDSWKHRWRSS